MGFWRRDVNELIESLRCLAGLTPTAPSIEAFYAADERRRTSAEVRRGLEWLDGNGVEYSLSWIVDTGELYFMSHTFSSFDFGAFFPGPSNPNPHVVVIATLKDKDRLDSLLRGWHQAQEDRLGIGWVIEELQRAGVEIHADGLGLNPPHSVDSPGA